MKKQNILRKYLSIYRFHAAYGTLEGIRRSFAIFLEIDLFDFRYRENTRTIKAQALQKVTYMPYWPCFTSVARKMIKHSHNYYISAIRYSDLNRKTVFIDFGSGLGKTIIIAAETKKFNLCYGIEIDNDLVTESMRNLKKYKSSDVLDSVFNVKGNIESENSIKELVTKLSNKGYNSDNTTLFIFNKNSYGPDVLEQSLMLIQKYFHSIVYLYQNPIHKNSLVNQGFLEFGTDDKGSEAHKNYKYALYFKHNYSIT